MRDPDGQAPPRIVTAIPGPASAHAVEALAAAECPSLTARRARRAEHSGAPQDPIVWTWARGINVEDADGNRYVDLTSGFGVATLGHGHPAVVAAVTDQAASLTHALGDLYPSAPKVALLSRLADLAPWPEARVVLGLSGSDAVAAALKTAVLATGRSTVVAFEGGYHGLAYGPLSICGYKAAFRQPFAQQLNPHVRFLPYPCGGDLDLALEGIRRGWPDAPVGAVVVEPMLGRGGMVLPPEGFLMALQEICREQGALLVVDEVFTGLGRTGSRFQCVADGVRPDLICIGKALGGGLPVSACLGRAGVMAAWGDPGGEAIHTGTFFGNPLACRAALAALDVLEREGLAERSHALGQTFRDALTAGVAHLPGVRAVRGRGLAVGIELSQPGAALGVVRRLLQRGYLTLPAGADASVLQLIPPLTVAWERLEELVPVLAACLGSEEPAA